LVVNPPNRQAQGAPPPSYLASDDRPLFRLNGKKMCKTLLPLNISGWCRCLAI